MRIVLNHFCASIYTLANRIVSRCRSEKERKALEASFNNHFQKVHDNEAKAIELERILSKKDELVNAVKTVQNENINYKEELSELEIYLSDIEDENKTLNSLIALICELHAKREWGELNSLILSLSNKYLPNNY